MAIVFTQLGAAILCHSCQTVRCCVTCRPGGLAGVWKGVIGVEDEVERGLAFPLVRLVEVLADTLELLSPEAENSSGEAVLATTGEAQGRGGGGGGGRWVEVGGVVLETPIGEGRIGREYVRRLAVEVSLGGAGTRRWGDGAPPVAAIGFGT